MTIRPLRCLALLPIFLTSTALGQIYQTDFDSFLEGTINDQDSWRVGNFEPSSDGQIIDEGSGNKVLQITGRQDWGLEVGRELPLVSTRQFYRVMMNYNRRSTGGFWFMDNYVPSVDSVDSIFWWDDFAYSNADPGANFWSTAIYEWYEVGIEVDQFSREITAYLFDGSWYPEDDSNGIGAPGSVSEFWFRGNCATEDCAAKIWIDDLVISEHNSSILYPFSCEGFYKPMADFPVTVKKTRVLPLKMKLFDVSGFEISDTDLISPPMVLVEPASTATGDAIDVSKDSLPKRDLTLGNHFNFTGAGVWQFNLSTEDFSAPGEYEVTVVSGNDLEYVIEPSCMTSFVVE